MAACVLIVRFSSLGDILQGQLLPGALRAQLPGARVDWLTKAEFAPLLRANQDIARVHAFEPRRGLLGLLRLAWQLRQQGYTHLYDAHNNLRSHLLCAVLRFPGSGRPQHFLRRSKQRWRRFLLFYLRVNRFPRPFVGQDSYLAPLRRWGVAGPAQAQVAALNFSATLPALAPRYVAIAASAAWELKRWPAEHWARLFALLPEVNFVLLGGPRDHFCAQIAAGASNARNMAGQLDFLQSAALLQGAAALVANDTGWLHLADVLGKPSVALIGPTAFGYPRHPASRVLEIDLPCKPCSKDGNTRCRNSVYQKCLRELLPERVAQALRSLL